MQNDHNSDSKITDQEIKKIVEDFKQSIGPIIREAVREELSKYVLVLKPKISKEPKIDTDTKPEPIEVTEIKVTSPDLSGYFEQQEEMAKPRVLSNDGPL